MLTRLKSSFHLSKGEKSYVLAYAIVVAVAAGLTVFLMADLEGVGPMSDDPAFYSVWTVLAGVIGGGLALYAARGWMGLEGPMGWARAIVGSSAAALIAAVIAGTLIMPVYGTFYAPLMLVTEFTNQPILAAGWYAAMLGAHYLMTILKRERRWRPEHTVSEAAPSRISTPLSTLSRAQLYHLRD